MSIKKIELKTVTLRFPTGYFGLFGKYVPGKLLVSDLPLPVILKDAEDAKEYNCELVEVVALRDYIPSVFSRMVEDMDPEALEPILLERLKVESINQIAFYLYRYGNLC